jgi:hypothetical protein
MTSQTMYDAASPPAEFVAGQPWAGYLQSRYKFAVWPLSTLKDASQAGGVLPIFGGPLTVADFAGADVKSDALDAVGQVDKIGGEVAVCLDVEQQAYDARPDDAVDYAVKFGAAVVGESGRVVYYGPRVFLDALRPKIPDHWLLDASPWVAEWEALSNGYPAKGWPAGDRGWQYAGNVTVNGKLVDVSSIESDFPLVRHATRLEVLSRAAVHELDRKLPHRKHPVAEPDRAVCQRVHNQLGRVLDL